MLRLKGIVNRSVNSLRLEWRRTRLMTMVGHRFILPHNQTRMKLQHFCSTDVRQFFKDLPDES